jgi:arylsulfatase A-like enzyme
VSNRPNILLILTDQHRLSLGGYGPTPCRTPNLDRLAAEGVRFETAYTCFPVCSSARASIMTGLWPHAHGICANVHDLGCSIHELEDRPELLVRRLQAAG